jgi:cell division protein FtsL
LVLCKGKKGIENKNMKKSDTTKSKKSILVTILIIIIVILAIILGYYIYSGYKLKTEINSLNNQISQLSEERDNLNSELSTLQKKYDLLNQDVQKIYKSCPKENACKGRFPGVSWYCNNVGDETDNPSHICICDSSCNMKATQIIA